MFLRVIYFLARKAVTKNQIVFLIPRRNLFQLLDVNLWEIRPPLVWIEIEKRIMLGISMPLSFDHGTTLP